MTNRKSTANFPLL